MGTAKKKVRGGKWQLQEEDLIIKKKINESYSRY